MNATALAGRIDRVDPSPSALAAVSAVPPPSAQMLARFDVAGPRYTSYPTADRFVEAFGPEDYEPLRASVVRASALRRHPRRCTCTFPFAPRFATTAPETR